MCTADAYLINKNARFRRSFSKLNVAFLLVTAWSPGDCLGEFGGKTSFVRRSTLVPSTFFAEDAPDLAGLELNGVTKYNLYKLLKILSACSECSLRVSRYQKFHFGDSTFVLLSAYRFHLSS